MKKVLFFLCSLFCFFSIAILPASAEGVPEIESRDSVRLVHPNPPEGLNYSYQYSINFFKADTEYAFMDDYPFPLTVKPVAVEEDVYVALVDLEKIYAPDFRIENNGDQIVVNHVGLDAELSLENRNIVVSGIVIELSAAPKLIQGEVCVPVSSFMSEAFAKSTELKNGYVAVAYNQEEVVLRRGFNSKKNQLLAGKEYGFLYDTYWFEEGNRTMNYRMYVPTTYDPEIPNKVLFLAHGGSRNQDYFFTDTNESVRYYTPIEEFAEKYGYILVAPNAYIKSGDYGDVEIPLQFHASMPNLSEEEKAPRILSEKGFMLAVETVIGRYNIDEDNIYMMGNSMGARGAFFMGNKHSDVFKAIVACALMPNLELYGSNPYPNLVDKPLFFVAGTEDSFFPGCQANADIFRGYLNDFTTFWNGGGAHSTAWARSLEEIFIFLNQQN